MARRPAADRRARSRQWNRNQPPRDQGTSTASAWPRNGTSQRATSTSQHATRIRGQLARGMRTSWDSSTSRQGNTHSQPAACEQGQQASMRPGDGSIQHATVESAIARPGKGIGRLALGERHWQAHDRRTGTASARHANRDNKPACDQGTGTAGARDQGTARPAHDRPASQLATRARKRPAARSIPLLQRLSLILFL